MILSRFFVIFPFVGLVFATAGGYYHSEYQAVEAVISDYHSACQAVEAVISNASKVYYPGNPLHAKGEHHLTISSHQDSTCVVEPGTPEDVGKILEVIDATKTPFAVKSGGHTVNPGFSSTNGIQIYTGKFSQVTYDAASNTAVIGTGLIWDNVYERLQEHNVAVLGGRVTGVGVGGLLLGGGYSFKTNQHGLAIDTIVGYNLVVPNGTVTYVTQSTHPDLFWGLKGGFNNFGIVTDFTMKTFPQTPVWGGQILYPFRTFGQVHAAVADFSLHSQDPKAAILPSYLSYQGVQLVNHGIFYDGPTPPPGTFDKFTSIPSISSDVKTRPYLDLILTSPSNATGGLRGTWQMVGVSHFSKTLLEAVESELLYWTAKLTVKGGTVFSYAAEPFMSNHLSHAESPSAWPAPSVRELRNAPNPLLVYFSWDNALYDDEFTAAVEESVNRLAAVAKREGLLSDQPKSLYGNYAKNEASLVDIYGENLPKLRALKAEIDPKNVMGLAGGFRF